jgi:uncharacterized BrkB/YihY/UPF0761 family membrane protein
MHKIPFIKRLDERKGVNIEKGLNEAFRNPKHGLSAIRSFGLLFSLPFFLCLGFSNLYFVFIHSKANLKIYHFIIFALISLIVNHFLVFKHKEYLVYFKKFAKMPRNEKRKWAWVSFVIIIGIIFFMIGSFVLLVHQKPTVGASVRLCHLLKELWINMRDTLNFV